MSRTITIELSVPVRVPVFTRRLRFGCLIHPEQVTDAWYAQGCPPVLDTHGLGRLMVARWRVSKWMRGCK